MDFYPQQKIYVSESNVLRSTWWEEGTVSFPIYQVTSWNQRMLKTFILIGISSGTWSSGRATIVGGIPEWDLRTLFIIVTHNCWVWKINYNPKLIVWPKSSLTRRPRTPPCKETEDLVDLGLAWCQACQTDWSLSIFSVQQWDYKLWFSILNYLYLLVCI